MSVARTLLCLLHPHPTPPFSVPLSGSIAVEVDGADGGGVCGRGGLEGGGGAAVKFPSKPLGGAVIPCWGGKKRRARRPPPQPPFLCFVITVKRKSLLVDCFHCGGEKEKGWGVGGW